MEILYTKRFQKHYKKNDAYIQSQAKRAIELFRIDPVDPTLRNHPLTGDYLGYRSIDVTGDFRIIFTELSDGRYELVELVDIGTHSQLYG